MSSSIALKEIFAAGRPLIEEWLDVAEQIAALRDVAAAKGLDWSQLKALMKAQIQDERDETGEGKRVKRIVEKAEFASAYADMLGLANMNENNFSVSQSYADEKGRGETAENQKSVGFPAAPSEPAARSSDASAAINSHSQATADNAGEVPSPLPASPASNFPALMEA